MRNVEKKAEYTFYVKYVFPENPDLYDIILTYSMEQSPS
jgi:hypothetical protein